MPVDILVGLQFGDCGKGRVVDSLASQYDIVARFNGGNNAGHTVKFDNVELKLHSVPSGIAHEPVLNIIGRGCVINPKELCAEIQTIQLALGRVITPKQLQISEHCHIITDEDIEYDLDYSKAKIGTTGKGIGPTYADKHHRSGLQLVDVIEDFPMLAPYMANTETTIRQSMGKNILCEGAQGTWLDIDHGDYPFVTSCNTLASHACTTLGFGLGNVREVIGVFKAYTTRVGEGSLEGEWKAKDGRFENIFNAEVGTTTGRQRRCAPLHLPDLNSAIYMNGATSLVMTKADLLTGYNAPIIKSKVWGHEIEFEAWTETTIDNSNFAAFLDYIQEHTGLAITAVSNGPNREDYDFNSFRPDFCGKIK